MLMTLNGWIGEYIEQHGLIGSKTSIEEEFIDSVVVALDTASDFLVN
jgi:hypothetical protein